MAAPAVGTVWNNYIQVSDTQLENTIKPMLPQLGFQEVTVSSNVNHSFGLIGSFHSREITIYRAQASVKWEALSALVQHIITPTTATSKYDTNQADSSSIELYFSGNHITGAERQQAKDNITVALVQCRKIKFWISNDCNHVDIDITDKEFLLKVGQTVGKVVRTIINFFK